MSKWDKYRSLLSKEQEAKYSAILKDNKEKQKINSDLYDEIKEEYDIARKSEEFKEWVKNSNNNNDSSPYTIVDLKLREIIHKNVGRAYFETLGDNRERARCAYISSENKLKSFRSAVYILYELPEPKAIATDDETKQCTICTANLKDHALPCGHVYCVECIGKMKCECPTCKKRFVKSKAIKIFF